MCVLCLARAGGCRQSRQRTVQQGKVIKMSSERQIRSVPTEFRTREEGDTPIIEGYFSVFGDIYNIAPGMSESIASGAFSKSLEGGDIRALANHDSTLVLGRTKAHTLDLIEDSRGLYGKITINSKDTDAMNLYERVKRGDVSQCSFGFNVRDEESTISDNGDVHWTLKDVDLIEVSVCTFPAYEQTNVEARSSQRDEIKKREMDAWKARMKERLNNGIKSIDAAEKD